MINTIHSVSNKTSRHSRSRTARRLYLSCLLIASIAVCLAAFMGQRRAIAQKPDEKWKKTGVAYGPSAQDQTNKAPTISFKEIINEAAKKSGIAHARASQRGAITEYGVLNVEFKDAPSRQSLFSDSGRSGMRGASVLTAIDRYADVFVDSDETAKAIFGRDDVLRIEWAATVEAPPTPPPGVLKIESKAVPDPIVRDGFKETDGRRWTGKGVIVAVADTGLDFRHPDFVTYDVAGRPTSRLLYLWDTTLEYQPGRGSPAPFSYPNGASIGILFTRDQLTTELRSANQKIPATDEDGHGTACAGVAAGNGNADKSSRGLKRSEVIGVAPEADLIGVRLGSDLENAYLMNAAAGWLDKTAGSEPLVMSCSFGGHGTGHDGQSIRELQLNARFPLDRAGRAIVIAAGNEGKVPIHVQATFAGQNNKKLITWNSHTEGLPLQIYFDSGERGLHIATAGDTQFQEKVQWRWNPDIHQWSARLKVNSGEGGLYLYNESGKSTRADLYSPARDDYGRLLGTFYSPSYNTLVGAPGTAANAITVGSYDWNDNFQREGRPIELKQVCRVQGELPLLEIKNISCYSSPGPTRTGTVKPEIVAPGEWYAASYAKLPGGSGVNQKGYSNDWAPDTTGNYVPHNGTSAATPYTAGIVALMMQKRPSLTLGQIKRLLTENASHDPYTGDVVPSQIWGYGKLDFDAVRKIFAALD